MKKSSTTIVTSSTEEIIEETPVKDEGNENETISSEKMTRDIQRLAHRLRSSLPCKYFLSLLKLVIQLISLLSVYHLPIHETQANKPTTLHLSQVVNRVSRCNYVLRRFVRQAQQCSPKATTLSLPPHESNIILCTQKKRIVLNIYLLEGRRRLFVDSPKQELNHSNAENQPPSLPPTTPRKASGVIKQLFASPSSSFKRTTSSSSTTTIISHDKRQKLF